MADKTIESDDELWVAFSQATLSRELWTHTAHVRVGYLHVIREGFDAALELLRARIRSLNAAHGTPETPTRGYHETITVAFLTAIAAACRAETPSDSRSFCQRHPELLEKDFLDRFYSRELLFSAEARRTFVAPDLCPLGFE
jgi:hypothetical protein